jgi:hypothetical protein
MTTDIHRFELDRKIPLEDAEMSLHLAMIAAEGLFGRARVRLDAGYHADEPRHAIIVDGTTEVGAVVTRVFTALLLREFGEDSFRVRRAELRPAGDIEGRAA